MRNKKTTALLLSILLLSGCTYQYDNKASTDVEYKFEKEKRVPINSVGDFSNKILTGKEFNRIIASKIDDGSWRGYVVHSLTYAPYNNVLTSQGLSIPRSITYSGTYLNRDFAENSGSDSVITSRDMSGWYGFHVDSSEITKHGSYVGANAFGISADVEVLNTLGAEIIFGSTQINEGNPETIWADIDIKGQMPKDVNVKDLRIEYLAKINGLSSNHIDITSPTIFNPSDMSHKTQVFMGELLAARLINIKTGEIYPVQLEWVFRSREAFL